MVTILLQTIIELLTGWKDSFFTWANEVGDKIAAIKTNTDELPGIKTDTADIVSNTAAVITPISNINTNVSVIGPDVASIMTNTAVIKNNANAIMTSSGQTAAYAEDIADNTLDCKNRLTTIGSDTTQIRADSGSMAADISEIKNTLGYYLYNMIVTEDADGIIANFDTDLKDYLQNAVVTIPADAGGISECNVGYVDFNQLVMNGNFTTVSNWNFGGTYTVSDNIANLSITRTSPIGTSTFNKDRGTGSTRIDIVADHKYFVAISIKSSLSGSIALSLGNAFKNLGSGFAADTWYDFSLVLNPSSVSSGFLIYPWNNSSSLSGNANIKNVVVFDITQAFGATIADYLYSLPDNGVEIIKTIFNKSYYSYNAGGSLVSVESVNGSYYPNASVSFGSSITDGGELDLVTGVLKVNTTPPSLVQLTPAPIRTLKGLNNIWADCGDIAVTYRESLKHYIEKQEGN